MDTWTAQSHHHQGSKNHLCRKCARWDFPKLFTGTETDAKTIGPPKHKADVERYDYYGDLWDIRPFPELLEASYTCPVCDLVIKLLSKARDDRTAPEIEMEDLKIEYRKHGLNHWFMALRVQIAPWKFEIPKLRSKSTIEEEKRAVTILPGERFPRPKETKGTTRLEYAARIVNPYCDFNLINSWLNNCADDLMHVSCRKARSDVITLKRLRFIDIQDYCISIEDVPQKYAALSYVWGAQIMPQMRLTKENFLELTTKQALKKAWSDVPTTVKDAMKVCENCGIPYLWVDALCVIQDGPDLQEELGQMTEIYSSAYVTIIAADGDSSWSGLRGISSPRDYKQETAEFGEISLVEGLPSFSVELDDSNWPHRAWTLQEHLFSKRCLIFLRNRMLFQCKWEWLDESIIAKGTPLLTTLKTPRTAPRIRLYSKFDEDSDPTVAGIASLILGYGSTTSNAQKSRKFLDFVEAYFQLDLTFDSDILNACKGIVTWFEGARAMSFFWATPTADLVYNLAFSLKDCKRRDNMPSWSWVGWRKNEGTKEYQAIDFFLRDENGQETRSDIQFYKLIPGNTEKTRPSLQSLNQESGQDTWHTRAALELFILTTRWKDITTTELEKLLVFKASARRIQLDQAEGVLSKRNLELSKNEAAASGGGSGSSLHLELVEIGSLWTKKFGKRAWQEFEIDNSICLIVKTDRLGISERIGIQILGVEKWKRFKPQKKWVLLG